MFHRQRARASRNQFSRNPRATEGVGLFKRPVIEQLENRKLRAVALNRLLDDVSRLR
jgi:hypothetical protein